MNKKSLALLSIALLIFLSLGAGYIAMKSLQEQNAMERSLSQLSRAMDLVKIAEKNLKESDYQNAMNLVKELSDENDKAPLLKRLEAIQALLATEKLVSQAEKEKTQDSLASAQTSVDQITDKKRKMDFQKRLDVVKKILATQTTTTVATTTTILETTQPTVQEVPVVTEAPQIQQPVPQEQPQQQAPAEQPAPAETPQAPVAQTPVAQ